MLKDVVLLLATFLQMFSDNITMNFEINAFVVHPPHVMLLYFSANFIQRFTKRFSRVKTLSSKYVVRTGHSRDGTRDKPPLY